MSNDMTAEELTELARLYYIDGCTQQTIAQRYGLSRVKIGRLLKQAQAEGIVDIRVRLHHPAGTTQALEHALVERFGLDDAIIAVDHQDSQRRRELLAGQVADYLDRHLYDTSVVAVGMGRNVNAVAEQAVSRQQRHCRFVCAIGGSYQGGETMNADQICRQLAYCYGGQSVTLYAPAIVAEPAMRDALLDNNTVQRSLYQARQADTALVGIGDILEDSNMVRMGWFSNAEIAHLRQLGVVGDIMGYDFIDITGRPAQTPLMDRVIGLNSQDLHCIPNVIAIASEATKISGILGALRSGVINTLAVPLALARAVLNLDQVIDPFSQTDQSS